MAPQRTRWWGLLAVSLGLAVAAVLATTTARAPHAPGSFGARPHVPAPPSPAPPTAAGEGTVPPPTPVARPVAVSVPRLHLHARVRAVGVDRRGEVSVPARPTEVGWYRFGAAPGDPAGSAVLVGHVDSRDGSPGALAVLYRVRAGDGVRVRTADGLTLRYRITARQTVPRSSLPDDLFRREGPAVLTLVTCAPPHDPRHGGYQNNLIVTAVPSGHVTG